MTTQDLKSEIIKVMEQVPEDALQYVFDYLKEVSQSSQGKNLDTFLKQTLIGDKELLERLAK